MKQFEAGNSIKLVFRFHDFDGVITDPDDQVAYIKILDKDDNQILEKTQLSRQAKGVYFYIWSHEEEGIYKAKVSGKINGFNLSKEKKFKIKRDD